MLTEEKRERVHTNFWAAMRDKRVLTLSAINFSFTPGRLRDQHLAAADP